ncbi:UDP-N-acetylglucosamine-transferase [Burkholderia pseudomallei]|uniref:UDP-N-acetylglucosamine-transferase n=1 Tax=Burkholderia pseudomallei TaxID=28450 RepID=UPI0005369E42|nr:UDP-N-acetylglucosamine-transferase [Burkholderia pseudomallei]KGW42108.1 glycosyltransferase family protein [Burkholderia pseudomallei MSHR1000]
MNHSIFVQIASYRDPQLIPTLVDLIDRASRPEALRIVVCRQHALEDTIGAFFTHGFSRWRADTAGEFAVHTLAFRGASIEMIDVPYQQSRGACWARNLIQQRYGNERYTLQLDSHHRFIDGWDQQIVEMLESLRTFSAKPLITAYLPGFTPGCERRALSHTPLAMTFFRFSPEGVVLFRARDIADWQAMAHPIPARFYSAHFAFADGHFAQTVRHDPHFFFHGEEISLAVRAFTHGYDLYHPHRAIAWHEYTRRGRPKIWDDHTVEAKANGVVSRHWGELDQRSHERNRALLGIDGASCTGIDFASYGLGTERTLAEYERYAGLSFAHRGVQQALIDGAPPEPAARVRQSDDEWKSTLKRANEVRVWVHQNRFSEVLAPLHSCHMTVHDAGQTVLHAATVDADEFRRHHSGEWFGYSLDFLSELDQRPVDYVVELCDEAGRRLAEIECSLDA